MKVGFIGLGIMGKPMAKHILKAGYPLSVYNRSSAPVDELSALGARACGNPREVAEASDVVITMLPDTPDVRLVALGVEGIIEGIAPGGIVIDMSSINSNAAVEIAGKFAERGVSFLDAPVSGGEIGAVEGTLAIMVGGNESVFAACEPLLRSMGKTVTRVGGVGAGNTVKLMNQIMVAIHLAALSEAFAFGKKAGIDPNVAYQAIRGGLAASRVMDTKIANIEKERYEPGFRIKLHAKDLRNAMAVGEAAGAALPFAEQVLDLFAELAEQGFAEEDHSALHRLFR
ncbi:NAD(P)-binding domain-containing protein [Paenibacillus sp.]|uniref:NAD(P)-binding domain-containing protein n=1 Tax=Paenibacillus sp. TaxID=58172 RepID=UPI002D747AA0|nr:NAD(P)-binding domain-containing protein [Paenibacillus sp.]HZG86717.1 NAD(P)-binding domain-containing protein [Paenibacillus sp.]